MIKQLNLQGAHEERPSRTQISRLMVGDHLQLSYNNVRFWVKVLFIRAADLVGIVLKEKELERVMDIDEDDLISFEIKHIIKKSPDLARADLKPFGVLSFPGKDEVFVVHTGRPRMIAQIIFGGKVEAKAAVWIDEPVDYVGESEQLLKRITDWYFYNHVNKK